ncbi:MAG: divalent-cation tolerance protein CutA [Pseudomonadota bacterium]
MKQYCLIKTTFKSKVAAKNIAKFLLKNKLIACAQISTIESLYLWQEKLVDEKEFLLTLKTRINLYKKVEKIIIAKHSYQVPQIIMLPIKNASQPYLDWLESCLKNN